MEHTYTYVIAPAVETNLDILMGFVAAFPILSEDSRLKTFTKKNVNDILNPDGQLLIAAGAMYYMVKALTEDFNPSMLQGVIDPEIYYVDTLPFNIYWL